MPRVVALACVALVLACAGPASSTGPALRRTVDVVLVGVFSGPDGAIGSALRNSVQVEADAINAGGGLLGANVEVVAADGEQNPAKAAELVREQVGGGDVALVVGPDSTASFLATRAVLATSGTPNCLTQVADQALSGARSSFEVGPSNGTEVATLIDGLQRLHPDLRRIALLDEGDDLGRSYDGQLAAQAGPAGLTYLGHVTAGADSDPRAALQQLAAQGAQVVVLSQRPAAAVRAAQAAGQLGPVRPLLAGFGSLTRYAFPNLGGDAAVGAVLAATTQTYLTGAPQAQWPSGYRGFVDAATRQYGYATDGVQMQATPAGADCLRQWARAVARAGTFAGAGVTRAWETLDLPAGETALGVRERVTPADHSSVAPEGMFAYTWARAGTRYRLQQAAGPTG